LTAVAAVLIDGVRFGEHSALLAAGVDRDGE